MEENVNIKFEKKDIKNFKEVQLFLSKYSLLFKLI